MKKIAVIGLGNVGSHLGEKLVRSGFKVAEIVHRDMDEALHFKGLWSSQIKCVPSEINAEYVFICVQDRYIEDVVLQLPENVTAIVTSCTFYFSGKFPNRKTGIFYPLQTFTKNKPVDWNTIPILMESTHREVMAYMKYMADNMKVPSIECQTTERQGYHLAAVWVNNFVNFILEQAKTLCEERELDFYLLKPLLLETTHKILDSNGMDIQTGPAIRGDEATISSHLGLLSGDKRIIYQALTRFIQNKKKDA